MLHIHFKIEILQINIFIARNMHNFLNFIIENATCQKWYGTMQW